MRQVPRAHTVAAPRGRRLQVVEDGDPGGFPVIAHGGTPGGAEPLREGWVDDARARSLRLIAYDRPGYGGSTPDPGRAVASAAADVAAIADALDIGRFATWGFSGGGPHALACAALLGGRVTAAGALSSPAPFDAAGLDWFAGQADDNVREHQVALEGAEPLRRLLAPAREGLLAARPDQMRAGFGDMLSEPDDRALTPEVAAYLLAGTKHGLAPGLDGWVDDDCAFVTPWGFDLGVIAVPVKLWHGVQDRFIPVSHLHWLAAHIPGAEHEVSDADGHLSLTMGRVPELHAWLAGAR